MDQTYLIIGVQLILFAGLLIGMSWILKEVKKGNKDQQEIKTRLTWIKKRQKEAIKK